VRNLGGRCPASLGDALQLAKQVQLGLLALVALPRWLFGLKATSMAVASKKPSLIYCVARGVLAVGLVLFGLEIVLVRIVGLLSRRIIVFRFA